MFKLCKAVGYSQDLLVLFNNINEEFNNLSHELSQADLMEQDILHQIEKGGFSTGGGYNLSRQIYENRLKRRKLKNELSTLRKLKSSFIDLNIGALKDTHESIIRKDKILKNLTENKIYKPRVQRVLRPNTNVSKLHNKVV